MFFEPFSEKKISKVQKNTLNGFDEQKNSMIIRLKN